MSDLRQAAQQALEALEDISNCHVGDYDLAGECASCHEVSYKPHSADCKKQNSIDALRAALAQQVEKQQAEPVPPSGYAYRYYPDTIRFNDASKVDGVWPIESIPYWFGAHPTRQNKKDGKNG